MVRKSGIGEKSVGTKGKEDKSYLTELRELASEVFELNEEKKNITREYDAKRKSLFEAMEARGLTALDLDSDGTALVARIKETENYEYDPLKLSKVIPRENFFNVIKVSKVEAKKYVPESVLEGCVVSSDPTRNVEVVVKK